MAVPSTPVIHVKQDGLNIYVRWQAVAGATSYRLRSQDRTEAAIMAESHSPLTGGAATNVLTSAGHGLTAGDAVIFTALTGGTGLDVDTVYYVIATGLTANAFEVSATLGGSAVDFSSDITAGAWHFQTYPQAILAVYTSIDDGDIVSDGWYATVIPNQSGPVYVTLAAVNGDGEGSRSTEAFKDVGTSGDGAGEVPTAVKAFLSSL